MMNLNSTNPKEKLPYTRNKLFIIKKNKHNEEQEENMENEKIQRKLQNMSKTLNKFQNEFLTQQKKIKKKLKLSNSQQEESNLEITNHFKQLKLREQNFEKLFDQKFKLSTSKIQHSMASLNLKFANIKEKLNE
jgi:hypothetical protein